MKLQKDDKWLKDARDLILAKFPALGSTMSRLDILSTNIPTAATDNNKIYYSKEFLQNLTTSEQAFILAHEVMHVEFEHIQRTLGRDKKTWNIATDAVINQLLINAGLDIPVGCVNMPDAINKSAEDMYQYLLGNPSKVEEIFNGKGAEKECENGGIDDHSNWVEIAEREVSENEKEGGNQSSFSKVDNDINPNKIAHNTDKDKKEIEKEFAQKNEDMKNDLASNMRESLSRFAGNSTKKETFAYGSIRNEKPVLNWKKELRRELEKEENIWSYRRANKRNYYCARQEVLENFEKAYIEVMLDTSGSVSDKLLLSFLSQLKPLIDKDIELRVACFDHEVYAFNVIKKEKDITSMQIVGRGGTNFDEAIKAFSEKKEVNKIIFTDGYCSVKWSDVPKSKRNIIWIIYDNPNYTAKYGRVIYVNSREILSALKDSVDEKNEMVRDR